MSQAFGWTVEEVEQHVVALIQSGAIKGRVDSQNKVPSYKLSSSEIARHSMTVARLQILQAKKTDYRADLFARAIRAGTDMRNANRKLLLRMRLSVTRSLYLSTYKNSGDVYVFLDRQQAELVIKSSKAGHHSATAMQLSELLQGD